MGAAQFDLHFTSLVSNLDSFLYEIEAGTLHMEGGVRCSSQYALESSNFHRSVLMCVCVWAAFVQNSSQDPVCGPSSNKGRKVADKSSSTSIHPPRRGICPLRREAWLPAAGNKRMALSQERHAYALGPRSIPNTEAQLPK